MFSISSNNHFDTATTCTALVIDLTGDNTTVTSILHDTIVLQGVLTANVTVFLPLYVKKYTVINNCVGTYYVTIKTVSSLGLNSYTNDVLDIFCNGSLLKLTGWNENYILNTVPSVFGPERVTPIYSLGKQVYVKTCCNFGMGVGDSHLTLGLAAGIYSLYKMEGAVNAVEAGTGTVVPIPLQHPPVAGATYIVCVFDYASDIVVRIGSSWAASGHSCLINYFYTKN